MPRNCSDHKPLAFADWPQADQTAWTAATRKGAFLQPGGLGATWRSKSRSSAQNGYGRWLGWLQGRGVDLAAEDPATRFTPTCTEEYCAFLRNGRESVTVVSYLAILCMVTRAMFPATDWQWLKDLHNTAKPEAVPSRRKHDRVVPAYCLAELGFDLMNQASCDEDTEADPPLSSRQQVKAALLYRDGLIIALLAARPVRVKNLLQMQIGHHLQRDRDRYILNFSKDETKTHQSYSTALPDALTPAFDRYLQTIRPLLMAAPPQPGTKPQRIGTNVWVNAGGAPYGTSGLQKLLERHTKNRFGHVVNAHLFRDCVASTMANEAPQHIRYAAHLLGHKSLRVTEQTYIAADQQGPVIAHAALLQELRAKGSGTGRR